MQNTDTEHSPFWGFWTTLAFGLGIAIVWVVTQGLTAVVLAKRYQLGLDQIEFHGDILAWATIVSAIAAILVTCLFIWLRKGITLRDYLAFHPITVKTFLLVLAVTFLFMGAQEFLSRVLDKNTVPDFMLESYKTVGWLPILWFAISVAGPVVEEVFFRGFLLQGLRHTFMGNTGAVVLTALLWAVIHVQYGLYEITVIFFMGLLFGAAFLLTRSIWTPIIMHVVNNFSSTIMLHWYLTSVPTPA